MPFHANIELGIRAFGSSVRVNCGSPAICDALQRYVLPALPRTSPPSCSPDIDISVVATADGFIVRINHQPIASVGTLHDAALAVVKALDDDLIRRVRDLRAVHAGAVLIDGRALLLPGSTHAGKSSLVAELLRRGASHFSDEYALIDNQGRTHAYPRPLLLRNGRPLQSMVLPEELNASFASSPAPVGWILALDYVPGGAWNIHELSQGETVMLLLRNSPHEMDHSPEMIDFFVCAAANAGCFKGVRGDAAEAATHVLELIQQN
jgi:hypothetical protein